MRLDRLKWTQPDFETIGFKGRNPTLNDAVNCFKSMQLTGRASESRKNTTQNYSSSLATHQTEFDDRHATAAPTRGFCNFGLWLSSKPAQARSRSEEQSV